MLTTLETAKAVLGIAGNAEDPVLNLLIAQASSVIEGHCDRKFGLRDEEETFRFDSPRPRLILSARPVVSIASVTVGGVQIDEGLYRLESRSSGFLLRQSGQWPSGIDVTVAHKAGWVLPGNDGRDLPEAVERACLAMVRLWRSEGSRDPLLKSTSVEGVGTDSFWVGGLPDGLPPEVDTMLSPYRTVWIV